MLIQLMMMKVIFHIEFYHNSDKIHCFKLNQQECFKCTSSSIFLNYFIFDASPFHLETNFRNIYFWRFSRLMALLSLLLVQVQGAFRKYSSKSTMSIQNLLKIESQRILRLLFAKHLSNFTFFNSFSRRPFC